MSNIMGKNVPKKSISTLIDNSKKNKLLPHEIISSILGKRKFNETSSSKDSKESKDLNDAITQDTSPAPLPPQAPSV